MNWTFLTALALLAITTESAVIPPSLLRRSDPTHPHDLLKRSPLTDCLASKSITLIAPGYSAYASASTAFNRRFSWQPTVLAYPDTLAKVQETVKCANAANVKVQARSGGHSYAAYGLGGQSGSLVVDLEKFQTVSLVSGMSGVQAVVGAGNRLGSMATKLYNLGGRAIPHGTCSGVGVGGHALHGGFGPTSRNWGLALDAIVGLKGVLADGSVFTCSATQKPDLFWALRGAGSSFGIVTEFTFKTYAAPTKVLHWSYGFGFNTANQAADAFAAYQDFVKTVPKEMWVQVYAENGYMGIGGSWFGTNRAQFDALIAPFEAKLTTIYGRAPSKTLVEQDWLTTLARYNGGPLTQYGKYDTFYAKSLEVPSDSSLTLTTIRSLFNYLFTTGASSPNPWFIIANVYGGPNSAINAVPLASTSYGHRDTLINFQFYGFTSNNLPPFPSQLVTLVNGMSNAISSVQLPVGKTKWPAYVNYLDSELTRADAHERYYGSQITKLKLLKQQFDPQQRFWNPQSINF